MRRLPAVLAVVAALIVVACSSSATPGWTYAPAPSASAAASGAASGSPAASGSAAASAPASAEASAPASAPASAGASAPAASGGAGQTLTITAPVGAATAGFQPNTATAPANTAFELIFDNQDNQAPHNLVLFQPDGTTKVALQGDDNFFQGPGQRQLQVPALPAGSYQYKCEVHPTTMTGTLTVQ